jgi:hypothetical protein
MITDFSVKTRDLFLLDNVVSEKVVFNFTTPFVPNPDDPLLNYVSGFQLFRDDVLVKEILLEDLVVDPDDSNKILLEYTFNDIPGESIVFNLTYVDCDVNVSEQSNTIDFETVPSNVESLTASYYRDYVNITWSQVDNPTFQNYILMRSEVSSFSVGGVFEPSGIKILTVEPDEDEVLVTFDQPFTGLLKASYRGNEWSIFVDDSSDVTFTDDEMETFSDTELEYEQIESSLFILHYGSDYKTVVTLPTTEFITTSTGVFYTYQDTTPLEGRYWYAIRTDGLTVGNEFYTAIDDVNAVQEKPLILPWPSQSDSFLKDPKWRQMKNVLVDRNVYNKTPLAIPYAQKGDEKVAAYVIDGYIGIGAEALEIFINGRLRENVIATSTGYFQFNFDPNSGYNKVRITTNTPGTPALTTVYEINTYNIYSTFAAVGESLEETEVTLENVRKNFFLDEVDIDNIQQNFAEDVGLKFSALTDTTLVNYRKVVKAVRHAHLGFGIRNSIDTLLAGFDDFYKKYEVYEKLSHLNTYAPAQIEVVSTPDISRGDYTYGVTAITANGAETNATTINIDKRWWLFFDKNGIGIEWDPVPDAINYKIYRGCDTEELDYIITTSSGITKFIDYGLPVQNFLVPPPTPPPVPPPIDSIVDFQGGSIYTVSDIEHVPAWFDNAGNNKPIFANIGHAVYVGQPSKFKAIEFLLLTSADSDAGLSYEYSIAGNAMQAFTPDSDGTNGMQQDGVISWYFQYLDGWESGIPDTGIIGNPLADLFWIKITANSSIAVPEEKTIREVRYEVGTSSTSSFDAVFKADASGIVTDLTSRADDAGTNDLYWTYANHSVLVGMENPFFGYYVDMNFGPFSAFLGLEWTYSTGGNGMASFVPEFDGSNDGGNAADYHVEWIGHNLAGWEKGIPFAGMPSLYWVRIKNTITPFVAPWIGPKFNTWLNYSVQPPLTSTLHYSELSDYNNPTLDPRDTNVVKISKGFCSLASGSISLTMGNQDFGNPPDPLTGRWDWNKSALNVGVVDQNFSSWDISLSNNFGPLTLQPFNGSSVAWNDFYNIPAGVINITWENAPNIATASFWYEETAFKTAFLNKIAKILFTSDGSVYIDFISDSNLVTNIDGSIGPAGGGTALPPGNIPVYTTKQPPTFNFSKLDNVANLHEVNTSMNLDNKFLIASQTGVTVLVFSELDPFPELTLNRLYKYLDLAVGFHRLKLIVASDDYIIVKETEDTAIMYVAGDGIDTVLLGLEIGSNTSTPWISKDCYYYADIEHNLDNNKIVPRAKLNDIRVSPGFKRINNNTLRIFWNDVEDTLVVDIVEASVT